MPATQRSDQPDGGRPNRPPPAHPERGAETGPEAAYQVEPGSFESSGWRCEADLYLPRDGRSPWPIVVMANVFGARRTWGLAPFAQRFAEAGLAALVFDYRHLGSSEGTPRQLIDPARQLEDWAAALAAVRSLDVVDNDRIAVWGTSFSGGHALVTASRDPGIAAVVAQVPFVDGQATIAHQARGRGPIARITTLGRALVDRVGGAVGRAPVTVPIVSEPGGGGLVDSPGAKAGFERLVPAGDDPVNRTPARVLLDLYRYRPGRLVDGIEVPVHVVVAEGDRLLPSGPTERMLDRLGPADVSRVPAGHFEVHCHPWFELVVDDQVDFLAAALPVAP